MDIQGPTPKFAFSKFISYRWNRFKLNLIIIYDFFIYMTFLFTLQCGLFCLISSNLQILYFKTDFIYDY